MMPRLHTAISAISACPVSQSPLSNSTKYSLTNSTAAGLPPPSAGLVLDHVAIGRGTQNYTCDNSTDQAIPKAIGALATLFNVTCLAAPFPALLQTMPAIALAFPSPDSSSVMSPANLFLSGHHYFTDLVTPTFNLNTASHTWGEVGCSKLNSTAGADPKSDVPNLKLASKSRDGCTIAEVYRLNTAGGQPPATCKGQAAAFEVQYAAEYWFWNNPSLPAYT